MSDILRFLLTAVACFVILGVVGLATLQTFRNNRPIRLRLLAVVVALIAAIAGWYAFTLLFVALVSGDGSIFGMAGTAVLLAGALAWFSGRLLRNEKHSERKRPPNKLER